eukprot:GILJ01014704.1.p1 GENE.GILJ01014704.1~~GILJ01014704.1.p1  ORF type:complete len:199 (+),score=19.71 GILJ01014704.1:108-704(+)
MSRLSVIVKEAQFKKDHDLFGKMDPYVQVTMGAQTFKTAVQRDAGKTPIWNEQFQFPYTSGGDITFTAFDSDSVGKDDKLGHCTIHLNSLLVNGRFDGWVELEQQGFISKKRPGRLNISIAVEGGMAPSASPVQGSYQQMPVYGHPAPASAPGFQYPAAPMYGQAHPMPYGQPMYGQPMMPPAAGSMYPPSYGGHPSH